MVVSERNRHADGAEAVDHRGAGFAGPAFHDPSLVSVGKLFLGEISEKTKSPGVENREFISETNHRAFSDLGSREGSGGFEGDKENFAPGFLQPTQLEVPDGADEPHFFGTG